MVGDFNQGQPISAANQPPSTAGLAVGPAIPPLNVTGLVVTKADLVAALRIYVPQVIDLTPLDGERFLLSLATSVANGRS